MATSNNESRRKFLKVVPAAVAGAVATKAFAQGPAADRRAGDGRDDQGRGNARRRDSSRARKKPRRRAGANTNLTNFNAAARRSTMPQDTEPAYVFKPSLPGKEPKGPATPGAPIKYSEAAARR